MSAEDTAVARLERVSKRFGQTTALADVTFRLDEGEVVALLGPNGAGKTTLLSVLLGLRRPDRGTARLFGLDPRRPAARRKVGATPQVSGLPHLLTVRETLALVRAHYARPAAESELVETFGLSGLERRQAGGLSGGEMRRLAVALAFAGNPSAVLLDEPTAGLDVESRLVLWRSVERYAAAAGTVLLTTHHLEEAEALASRIVVLNRGRIAATGSVRALLAAAGAASLEQAYLTYTRSDT